MRPTRNLITPLRVTMLGIRLIVLLLSANCVYYLGSILFSIAGDRGVGLAAAGPYAAMLLVYIGVILLLLRYSDPIAKSLSRNIPGFAVASRWSRVELLAAIIAGVAAWEFLAAIPGFIRGLFAIVERYTEYTAGGVSDRDRFNTVVIGFIGELLRIGVSALVFLKSGRIALYWDRRQSAEGLRATRAAVR